MSRELAERDTSRATHSGLWAPVDDLGCVDLLARVIGGRHGISPTATLMWRCLDLVRIARPAVFG